MANPISRFFRRLKAEPTLSGHKIYVGKYQDGEAEYEYVEQDGQQVLDGPISISRKYDYHYKKDGWDRAEGQFDMGLKDGPWVIRKDIKSPPSYAFKLDVNFVKGYVDGKLTYMRVMCPQKDVFDTHFVSCNVHEGRVTGDVEAVLSSARVTGRCDEQGRPDGEWERTINEYEGNDVVTVQTDTEIWEHGVIKESFSIIEKTQERKKSRPYIVTTIDSLLSMNVMSMINFVKVGTLENKIHLRFEAIDYSDYEDYDD